MSEANLDNTKFDTYRIVCGVGAHAHFTKFAQNGNPATGANFSMPASELASVKTTAHLNAALITQATETFNEFERLQAEGIKQPCLKGVEYVA